ncbi:glycosyltransferase family 9 protein [Rivularia sp. UHCC 0363]|uniref:glycosyltransferase family 9 protein n=1 Tax=Rivularia sp. UHCC 0363 TaxID=3110244 RepID=UPI002B1F5FFC|nr:glycosyltransferase family 9 protein [Rivularia sp. UHCC 0363]MEA5593768.1 glycosyltransferase family 9 protein [Rivularia sp. UHCC 0363]
MRIVALVPGGIGEQILFFPTLDNLKRKYNTSRIDVVCEPSSKAAYRVSKSVDDLLAFDFKDRNSMADWGNLIGTIRDREYDIAITPSTSWLNGLMLWLSGINTRVGFKGDSSLFFNRVVPQNKQQYAAYMYCDLLQGLGINSSCPELEINVPKPDIEWATSEQLRLGVKDTGYILVVDGLFNADNSYPAKQWLSLIQDFKEKQPDMPVVVVSKPDNQDLLRVLKLAIPDIKETFPDNIGKLAGAIAGANLMLCTDSPLVQLAVFLQTYTIALFGSTEPTKLLPQSDKFIAIKSNTGIMADIQPATILEKIWQG